jgi:murein DD-endopeptidase MepM/ murein hydrolase activator NlpD
MKETKRQRTNKGEEMKLEKSGKGMQRNGIAIRRTGSVGRRCLVLPIPRLLIYVFVATLLLSWAVVGYGGYLGISLYHAYHQLKEENTRLIQKEIELAALRLTMKSIQKNGDMVRDILAQERKRMIEVGLGRGGVPVTDPYYMVTEDVPASGSIAPPVQSEDPSILNQARALQKNLEELVETIGERRQLLDSTPSILPVQGQEYRISSEFGWRRSPFTGQKEFHHGLDISAPKGTPIIAPGEGLVIKVGHQKDRGKYLQIDHGRQCITTYSHLSGFNVRVGQEVKRGEVLAYMGSTGRSTGPHLHYEIEIKGNAANPMHYILNARAD